MQNYIAPRIEWADLFRYFRMGLLGAVIAGLYGIAHDQITYSIGPEYFTKLKFQQFHYADFGMGDRVFAACIGFLATWWVGFLIAWFLCRRLLSGQPLSAAYKKVYIGFAIVFACGILSGLGGYAIGLWRGPDADYSRWNATFAHFQITDTWAFVRVAYIHNASYAGGLLGLVIALLVLRPNPVQPQESQQAAAK